MKPINLLSAALIGLACLPAAAQLIGVEDFDSYVDGAVAGLTGGTGFDYDNINDTTTGTISDWDNVGGAPNVTGGQLITDNTSAKREYNGDIEGGASDDGPDTERAGALRGVGQVFYRFSITRSAGATWSGASSYDFGTERVFFGVPGAANPGSSVLEFGVQVSGGATYYTDMPADDANHDLVAVLDFDNDQIGLWVDPDGTDFYDAATGSHSADAIGAYTGTNWSTAIRFGSGGSVAWDDLQVALDALSIGLQDVSPDSDGDGLPNDWEIANGLDPNDATGPNGADGNPDDDGLTNTEEYEEGTNATVADTDNDGLDDGPEVKTHFTNPLDPDEDKDSLTDGAEINTHGTDPFLVDTDGGGTSDFTEVALGTNPVDNSADDPATNGDLDLIGIEFFDEYGNGPLEGAEGGTGWDYDNNPVDEAFTGHSTKASDWSNTGGAPVVQGGRLVTQGSSIKREFHGGSNNQADVFGESAGSFKEDGLETGLNGRDILYAKVELTRRAGAEWSGLSLYNYGAERIFVGVNGTPATFGLQDSAVGAPSRMGVFDEDGGAGNPVAPVDGETNVIAAKFDFLLSEVTMFVNPDLSAAEPEFGSAYTATIVMPFANMLGTGIRLGSGGTGTAEWDKLVVGTTWESLNVQPVDGDSDGLPGDWEDANDLDDTDDGSIDVNNGPAGDPDEDGLNNLEEYETGTAANNPDTDGDGLTDGTGEMLHGTDPLLADTDGDGLDDGDEVDGNNPNEFTSDPLLADTDSDGQPDGVEVLGGPGGVTSDPNDPNDTVGGPIGLIGCEGFFYSDGPVAGLTGGDHFDYENWLLNDAFTGHTGTSSDWDGDATVTGGILVTMETNATRDYNGPGEGAGTDAAPTDARMGAVNEGGSHRNTVVYFKVAMTRRPGATTSLIGSDDFGAQRVAFGVVDNGGFLEWGLMDGDNVTSDFDNVAVDDQTYTVVGKLDYTGDLLSIWVDPDLGNTEANNPAVLTMPYTNTNWSSGIRLSSAGTGATEWDNVVVANNWEHLNKDITPPAAEVEIIVNGYDAATGELSVTVNNLPDGDHHLRESTDAQAFVPLEPTVDFDNTTPMPLLIPVDPSSEPTLLLQVFDGLSDAPM